jgi:hypothetical protein
VPPTEEVHRFTALSAQLTGFDPTALEATGLTGTYCEVAARQLGPELLARLLLPGRQHTEPADRPDEEPSAQPDAEVDAEVDADVDAAARAVTYLWYTGTWPGPPPFVVSARSYAEGLVWKAAGLRAPATGPGGYGSWAGPAGPGGSGPAPGGLETVAPGAPATPGAPGASGSAR